MRKTVFFLLLMFTYVANAQTSTAKVTLKNGTILVGTIKNFDPLKQITLVIAGNPVEIQMTDVQKVEQDGTAAPQNSGATASTTPTGNENFIVTDNAEYPDSINITLGGQVIPLYLVRGGEFMMGYNGHHSLAMMSEPIHRVRITTFYVADQYVTNTLWSNITKQSVKKTRERGIILDKMYDMQYVPMCFFREEAELFFKDLTEQTGKPYRFITESEWEYVARSDKQHAIFHNESVDWCYDYLGNYQTGQMLTDPMGPSTGKQRVIRIYNDKPDLLGRFDRSLAKMQNASLFRIAIKASDLIK
jgi:small nuclear ribonucleoprotein (snRNP)-like protein